MVIAARRRLDGRLASLVEPALAARCHGHMPVSAAKGSFQCLTSNH